MRFRVLGLAFCFIGCRAETAAPSPEHTLAPARVGRGDVVVAEVDDLVITQAQVREVVARTGLSPRRALQQLVRERLLAQEASARGFAASPDVRAAARRAAAHALLAGRIELEEDLPEDEDEVRAERLAALLDGLRAEHGVRYYEDTIERMLAPDEGSP